MSAALLPARAACAAAAAAGPSGRRTPQPFAAAPRYQRRQVAVRGYRVDLELLSGEVQQLEVGDGETILEAIMDKGIDTPYDCCMGVCLRCAAKLESGSVDQEAGMLSDDVQDMGYALLCVAVPRSDCRVRIIPEEELMDEAMATSAKQQAQAV